MTSFRGVYQAAWFNAASKVDAGLNRSRQRLNVDDDVREILWRLVDRPVHIAVCVGITERIRDVLAEANYKERQA